MVGRAVANRCKSRAGAHGLCGAGHPDIWSRTRWVMAPKDYCIFILTGEVVADPMTCFGIVDQQLQDDCSALLDLVPGAAQRLPPVAGFTRPRRASIRAACPVRARPMVVGAMDAWSGLLGAGVCEDGQGLYLSGTSEILGCLTGTKPHSRASSPLPNVRALCCMPDPHNPAARQWSGSHGCSAKRAAQISELAASADVNNLPVFLPHLEGERAPLWDIASARVFLRSHIVDGCGRTRTRRAGRCGLFRAAGV